MAILTGELNIDDLISNGHNVFGSRIEIVYILFLIFLVFVCNIVLMNVFTGLAVGDVANVMNKAEVSFQSSAVVSLVNQFRDFIGRLILFQLIKARHQMKLVANARVRFTIVNFVRLG